MLQVLPFEKMIHFYCFCIILNFIFINGSEKVVCGRDGITNFLTDEIKFFESENFPNSITKNCQMTFITNTSAVEVSKNNLHLIFVITNGNIDQMSLGFDDNGILSQSIGENEDYYFISITNNTNLTFDLSVITEYNAFQGYIINDDWNVGCPLESISKIDPYSFSKNPNEILYLRSTFLLDDHFGDIPSKCIWNFVAPDDDYQFKLVVLNFPSDLNTTLLLSYGDNVNQNLTFDNIELHHAYYLDSQQLRIIFVNGNGNTMSTNKFEAFLGIIYTNIDVTNLTDAGCQNVSIDSTKTTWKLINGYPNNAQCLFNLSLSIENQYVATIVSLTNEFNIDHLTFHYSDKDTFAVAANQTFVFQTLRNGYNKYALWNFESDGNYASRGFQVDFEEIVCKCNNPNVIVPCLNEEIMKIMPNYDTLYCGNLNCSFTIKINPECQEKNIAIKLNPPLGNFFDIFSLTSNNDVILKSKTVIMESDKFITTLPSSHINVFQIFTQPSINKKYFSYTVRSVDPPKIFQNITLTYSEPSCILNIVEMNENSFVFVELDDELIINNDTFEVYSNFDNALEFITFFDDTKFEKILINHSFFDTTSKNSVKFTPTSTYLYIYKRHIFKEENNGNAVIFFRALNAHTKNCVFKQNIFDSLNVANNENIVSMLANERGDCEIVLLNRPGIGQINLKLSPLHEVHHFWTTSKEETVKVYRGGQSDELLFEYNKSTIERWNSLMLASGIYTIVVPPSKSAVINLNIAVENTLPYPYKGLWATPNYGSPTTANTYYTEFLNFNVSQNIIAKVSILSFDVSSDGKLEFVDSRSNTVLSATYAGQMLNFTDISVKINYYDRNAGYFGVLMEVETFRKI